MLSRRDLMLAGSAVVLSNAAPAWTAEAAAITKPIPSTGERIPVIGMGASQTFDVGSDAAAQAPLAEVLRIFFARGGTVIDSSPMYGRSEQVIGDLLGQVPHEKLFAATKVWTDGREAGIRQMEQSMQRMGVAKMDLMQIHNLRDWKTHLPVLREWKARGRIRYLGATIWQDNQHAELVQLMKAERFDFIQLNYSVIERAAEQTLLPLARDQGVAVLANRPFGRGEIFSRLGSTPLPEWAKEFDCSTWAQFLLKYVVSHPDITCAIPATSKAKHAADNMGANYGRLPDAAMRERMMKVVAAS